MRHLLNSRTCCVAFYRKFIILFWKPDMGAYPTSDSDKSDKNGPGGGSGGSTLSSSN